MHSPFNLSPSPDKWLHFQSTSIVGTLLTIELLIFARSTSLMIGSPVAFGLDIILLNSSTRILQISSCQCVGCRTGRDGGGRSNLKTSLLCGNLWRQFVLRCYVIDFPHKHLSSEQQEKPASPISEVTSRLGLTLNWATKFCGGFKISEERDTYMLGQWPWIRKNNMGTYFHRVVIFLPISLKKSLNPFYAR